ncbi:MAG: penicillin-binding protein activator [Rubellimicrobium sp.]|nr:penicillin-binding protein activator [Rubellimicrobium sp.]
MFAKTFSRRATLVRTLAAAGLAFLAACAPMPGTIGEAPPVRPGSAVKVALLVPAGSGNSSDELIAANLENAARLAVADLGGAGIDLRVYATAGDPARAAQVAVQAVADGAGIILGPLYAEEANAAGVAVAPSGVNLLAFSNNPTIAGGNVFVLGQTFRNTADRLVRYGLRNGVNNYLVVHGDDLQGQIGSNAIAAAVRTNGGTVAGIQGYPMSQSGILGAAPRIAAAARSGNAGAVFMTAGVNADLPILATALPEAGLGPDAVRYLGLTRWNAVPQALTLPGLQGGLFALPDQQMSAQFEARYTAAYGSAPHPLASLAYDGIAAIGALVARGDSQALGRSALTQAQGFQGTSGIFRLLPDGTNERGLAVAEVRGGQVVVLDPAPRAFGGAGS